MISGSGGVWAVLIPVFGLFIEVPNRYSRLGSRSSSLSPVPCNFLSLKSFDYGNETECEKRDLDYKTGVIRIRKKNVLQI